MTSRIRGFVILATIVLAFGSIGTAAAGDTSKGSAGKKGASNAERFADITFGQAGRAALEAGAPEPQSPSPPTTFTEYRTPNEWLLRPAGTQLDTQRAPTGVIVSPNAQTVVAVSSGIFDEQITVVDAASCTPTGCTQKNEFTTDLYMGAAIDQSTPQNLFVSTGSRNKIYQYGLVNPPAPLACVRCANVFPGLPCAPGTFPIVGGQCASDTGLPPINVIGYPGNMALASDGRLFVVGNLSVPSTYIVGKGGPPCSQSNICSVVNVVDVSNPIAPTIPVSYIPVGRDAFGIVLNEPKGKLYVSNWADESNSLRAGGLGTISVVDLTTNTEVQVFAVGHHPSGIALSPNGSTLFVANSTDDSLSRLTIGGSGLITGATTIDARTTPDAPRAAVPLALSFSADGNYLFVALAGQNVVEVRTAAGEAITRDVDIELIRRRSLNTPPGSCDTCQAPPTAGNPLPAHCPANRTLGGKRRPTAAPPTCVIKTRRIPHTYIPAGWYPSALASAAHPSSAASTRLYVTNLKGVGAGGGENAQAAPLIGTRTQGVLQVIDIPTDAAAREAAFNQWTATTVENNNWASLFKKTRRDAAVNTCRPAPLPDDTSAFSKFLCKESRRKKGTSPYHVLYIVKENKTFDSYFGDMPTSGYDADSTFLLFGETGGSKNHHNLARTFTVGDNFWADSEQSTTGHRWTSAGYANEYVELTWNPEYSQGLRGNRGGGQYEGSVFPGGLSDGEVGAQEGEQAEPEERLVDLLTNPLTNPRGITFRIYSDDVNGGSPAEAEKVPLDLWGFRTSFIGHGRDLDFPDTDRARLFLTGSTVSNAWSQDQDPQPPASYCKEIGFCGAPGDAGTPDYPATGFCDRPGAAANEYQRFSLAAWVQQYNTCVAGGGSDTNCQSAMPNFIYMALPVNHTVGFNPGSPTPQSMVADNDYALGLILQGLSQTPFWKNTLVLVTEDDTQLTGDHVDAHRTYVLSAGGLSRQHGALGSASHQSGSLPSILKTIQALFRLPSLSIYDRAAVPLHDFIVVKVKESLTTPGYTAADPGIPFAGSPFGPACTPPPTNPQEGILARLSRQVDWRLDQGDPALVTAIMYHGLRGWPLPEKYLALGAEKIANPRHGRVR